MAETETSKNVMKFIPDKKIELREFLTKLGVKNIERRTILINGVKSNELNQIVDKNDEIIVLPMLKGGY